MIGLEGKGDMFWGLEGGGQGGKMVWDVVRVKQVGMDWRNRARENVSAKVLCSSRDMLI